MNLLPIPLPPQWESVVGWAGGPARWLSACWTCCGDCPWLEDGRTGVTGSPFGWQGWSRHRAVAPHLASHDIGSSEADGCERLLVDLVGRQVFVADAAEARWFVHGQWPPEEPIRLSQEQIDAVLEQVRAAMASRPLPTADELMRRMREHSRLVAEMVAWLDRWAATQEGMP
jgi:hypothetical protein